MLYITSSCSFKKRIIDAVGELVQLGFKNIELTGRTQFYNDIEEDLFNIRETHKLNYLIHNYFPPQIDEFVLNFASEDPDIKKKTFILVEQAVKLLKRFGISLYTLHPGFRNDLMPKLEDSFFIIREDRPNKKENFYRMVDIVLRDIIDSNFKIAFENLCPKNSTNLYSYINSPKDIDDFLNYYNRKPNVGFLLDLGHLNVASNYLNFDKYKAVEDLFNRYMDRIFEIHISENDGYKDLHGISPVDSWQIEYLSNNKGMLKDIPIVLEWQGLACPETYERFETIRYKLAL